jgi:hypothetical protein
MGAEGARRHWSVQLLVSASLVIGITALCVLLFRSPQVAGGLCASGLILAGAASLVRWVRDRRGAIECPQEPLPTPGHAGIFGPDPEATVDHVAGTLVEAELRSVQVGKLLEEVAATLRPLMEARRISLQAVMGHRNKPLELPRGRFREVVHGLLEQAVNEAPRGELLQLMTRELSGVLVINVRGTRPLVDDRSIRPELRSQVLEWGGDVWPESRYAGFGMTLPLRVGTPPVALAPA